MASESLFSSEQIKIPTELPEIMKNYTKHIIKTQPQDLIAASADKLAKQQNVASSGKRLDKQQLETFYAKEKANVPSKEISDAAEEIGLSSAQLSDVLALGGFSDPVPWVKVWALLLAASSGTLPSTVELLAQAAGDNGNVSVSLVLDVVNFLAERDSTVNKSQVNAFNTKLTDAGSKEIGIESLKEIAAEELSPKGKPESAE